MEVIASFLGMLTVAGMSDSMAKCEAGILQGDLNGPIVAEYIDNYEELHAVLHYMYVAVSPDTPAADIYVDLQGFFFSENAQAALGESEYSVENCDAALELVR